MEVCKYVLVKKHPTPRQDLQKCKNIYTKGPSNPKAFFSNLSSCAYECKALYFFDSWSSDGWPSKLDINAIWDCMPSGACFLSSIILHCASILRCWSSILSFFSCILSFCSLGYLFRSSICNCCFFVDAHCCCNSIFVEFSSALVESSSAWISAMIEGV